MFIAFSLGMILLGCGEAPEDTDFSSVRLNFAPAETDGVMLDHGVQCNVPKQEREENEDKILNYLHEEYGYTYGGVIAQSEYAFLPVDGAGYQAVLFYPRVYTVSGTIKDESAAYSIEICFPCVNTLATPL